MIGAIADDPPILEYAPPVRSSAFGRIVRRGVRLVGAFVLLVVLWVLSVRAVHSVLWSLDAAPELRFGRWPQYRVALDKPGKLDVGTATETWFTVPYDYLLLGGWGVVLWAASRRIRRRLQEGAPAQDPGR